MPVMRMLIKHKNFSKTTNLTEVDLKVYVQFSFPLGLCEAFEAQSDTRRFMVYLM